MECVKATQMSWSGGIAGHYGTNYNFTFRVKGVQKIWPDSIWIGDNVWQLFDSVTHNHVYKTSNDGYYTYITFGVEDSHDDGYNSSENIYKKSQKTHTLTGPPNTNGYPAILVLTLNGKHQYCAVKHIDSLEPQSYP